MKYIKLHKYDADKNPVFIDPKTIVSFSRNDAHNATVVCMIDGQTWWVSETVEETIELLKTVSEYSDEGLTIFDKKGSHHYLRSVE